MLLNMSYLVFNELKGNYVSVYNKIMFDILNPRFSRESSM